MTQKHTNITIIQMVFRCLIALVFFFESKARSATIASSIRYRYYVENVQPLLVVVGGGPTFVDGSPYIYFYGNITIASDPDEEIYSLVLQMSGYGNYSGAFIRELAQPPDAVIQEWGVDWHTNYAPYPSPYFQLVEVPGTASLIVNSSLGTYELANYTYSYFQQIPIPEPSSAFLICIGSFCMCGYRTRLDNTNKSGR